MNKEEFYNILAKPESECNGGELHLRYLFFNNNSKSIFKITGLDFSLMFYEKSDTSGIKISRGGIQTISIHD